MILDERATEIARAIQRAGIEALDEYMGADQAKMDAAGVQTGRWRPWRKRPNTPPVRTPEQKKRRKARKAHRAARARNR